MFERMLRKRALQVSMVKTDKSEAPKSCTHLNPEQINNLVKDLVTHTAVTIGLVYAVGSFISTRNKIAVIKAAARLR